MLVFETYAGQQAEPQPQLLIARPDDADDDVCAAHPKERFKRVHREEVAHRQKTGRGQHRQRRDALGEAPPAQFARDQAGEQHSRGACQRGQETNGSQGLACQKQTNGARNRAEPAAANIARIA